MRTDALRLASSLLLTHSHGSPAIENLPVFYMPSGSGGSGHATGGHAWYQRQFSLIQYDAEDEGKIVTNFGMSGSWLQPYGIDFPRNPCEKKGMRTEDYETFEGGSSYSESVFGRQPKWKVGDSVGCYRAYTQSNMFHTHESQPHACSWDDSSEPTKRTMGLAQLSNRLLLFPDGMSFEKDGMIGISYARTPFGKLNQTDHRNFWTLIFDSENYAGPVAYFLPEFWGLRPKDDEEATQDFGDYSNAPEIQMSSPAWECHAMPNYVDGSLHKLLPMSVPQRNGRTVLWMGQRAHEDSELFEPLEEALGSGHLDPRQLLGQGTTRPHCRGNGDAKFGDVATWATDENVIDEAGDCLWTLKVANSSCPQNGLCDVPQYYDSGKPVDPSQASAALREARFPTQPFPTGFAYDALSKAPAGGCRDSPGPADSTLYCAKTMDDTWVGYRWYRFVDQPGLQQQRLSEAEKAFMQQRVETLHRMVPTAVSRWINGRKADEEGLARMDAAAIATPPKGLEIGYVPIVLYQGYAKPAECSDAPPPAPTPTPTPSPTPKPTPAPSPPPGTCEALCMADGHCCMGAISSYQHPSCAMGCTIAKHTSSLEECQQTCRDNDNTCVWSIAGISMSNCKSCPMGCDADGEQECLSGCAHADALSNFETVDVSV